MKCSSSERKTTASKTDHTVESERLLKPFDVKTDLLH